MPFEKLTAEQLNAASGTSTANAEYVAFLRSLRVGQGGRTTVKDEGTSKQTIKNRLIKAAGAAGVTIKFRRSSADEVLVEVTGRA